VLTRLTPSQASANWDRIKETIRSSLPPAIVYDESIVADVLEAVLQERAQVWVLHTQVVKEGKSEIEAIILTTVVEDWLTKSRTLLIYSLYGFFADNNQKDWAEALDGLRKYARSRGCEAITAYSDNMAAIRLAERLGGNASYRYIVLEV